MPVITAVYASNNSSFNDVNQRIASPTCTMANLAPMWTSSYLSLALKIRLYNSLSDASKLSKSNERTCVRTHSCARKKHASTQGCIHAYSGLNELYFLSHASHNSSFNYVNQHIASPTCTMANLAPMWTSSYLSLALKIRLYNSLSDASKLSKSNERTCVRTHMRTHALVRTHGHRHARTHARMQSRTRARHI